MYQTIPYEMLSDRMLKQMPKGIFLTVKTDELVNTMVIGWGQIGFIWGKQVFIAYVRYTRHTYDMLEKTQEFTISVPLESDLRQELAFCGRKSGRDMDKIQACGLKLAPGRKVKTPIVEACELHYECKVIYKQPLDGKLIEESIKTKYYEDDDYHMVYYGEIVDSYLYQT